MLMLTARLCALCAACALMQLALGDGQGAEGLGMIAGLLMLHLVISGGYELVMQLSAQRDLDGIFEILMR